MKTAVNFKFRWGMYLLFCGISAVLGHIPHLLGKLLENKGDEASEHALWTIPILFFCFAALGIWGVWPQLRDGGFFEISTDENGLEWRSFRWRKSVSWSEIARAQKRHFVSDGTLCEEVSLWDGNGETWLRWFYPRNVNELQKTQLSELEAQIIERSGVSFELLELPFLGNGAVNLEAITGKTWRFFRVGALFAGLLLTIAVLAALGIALSRQIELAWLSGIAFSLALVAMLFDTRREISEHGVFEKSFDRIEIAWQDLEKIRVEGEIAALIFISQDKQVRVPWPPLKNDEELLHFLESKREQFGFQVER